MVEHKGTEIAHAHIPIDNTGMLPLRRHGTSVMVTPDLQPVSPLSLRQSKILLQQFLQVVAGKSSDSGGRWVCRECCKS